MGLDSKNANGSGITAPKAAPKKPSALVLVRQPRNSASGTAIAMQLSGMGLSVRVWQACSNVRLSHDGKLLISTGGGFLEDLRTARVNIPPLIVCTEFPAELVIALGQIRTDWIIANTKHCSCIVNPMHVNTGSPYRDSGGSGVDVFPQFVRHYFPER